MLKIIQLFFSNYLLINRIIKFTMNVRHKIYVNMRQFVTHILYAKHSHGAVMPIFF